MKSDDKLVTDANPDQGAEEQAEEQAELKQSDPKAPLDTLAAAEDRLDERTEAFERAKAMLEGPGGDIGTEIDVSAMHEVDKLPILPIGIDTLGRLWAIDHHEGKLRLVGRAGR